MGSFALLLAALAVATAAALGDADVWRRHHHDNKVAAEAPAVLHKTPPGSHGQEKKYSHAHAPLPRFAEHGAAATTTTNHKKDAHPHHKLAHMPRFAELRVSQHTRKTSAAASKASRKSDGAAVKAEGEKDVAAATCAKDPNSKACKKAGGRAKKASKSAKKSSDKAAEKWRKTGAAKAKAGDLAGSKAAYVDGERCARDGRGGRDEHAGEREKRGGRKEEESSEREAHDSPRPVVAVNIEACIRLLLYAVALLPCVQWRCYGCSSRVSRWKLTFAGVANPPSYPARVSIRRTSARTAAL